MKKLFLLAALAVGLTLSACAITTPATTGTLPVASASAPAAANPAQTPGVVLAMTPADACNLWAAALNVGAGMKLNAVQVHQVGILETQINPLCKAGSPPPTGQTVQTAIQQALVNLAVIEGVDYATKYAAPAPSTPSK